MRFSVRNFKMVRVSAHLFTGNSSAGAFKWYCRFPIETETGLERLATSVGGVWADLVEMADIDRPVCVVLERSAPTICELDASAGCVEDQRSLLQLGGSQSVCLSPVLFDKGLPIEGQSGGIESRTCLPVLDEPTMVSPFAGASERRADNVSPARGLAPIEPGGPEPSLPKQFVPADRLEIIRDRFRSGGVPEKAIGLIMAGRRATTHSSYQAAWNIWSGWCFGRGHNPLSNDLNAILLFLSESFESGKAYRTINVYRSMFSSTLQKVDGEAIGQHPLVTSLMAGVFNSKPPQPRYESMWDVDSVLTHLRALRNGDLSLAQLARKLACLLALSTLLRVSELASIGLSTIQEAELSLSFSLLRPRKSQHGGPLHKFSLPKFNDPELDPVSCMLLYVDRTRPLRTDTNKDSLFIACVKPHKPVVGSTISGWLKKQLGEAGVDIGKFSAHSTRGAAASKAAAAGVPLQTILTSASWAKESTFTTFYRRDKVVERSATVAEAVLQLE